MKAVRFNPSDPDASLAELEAQYAECRARLDAAAVLFAAVKANSVVTSSTNPDGTTTWTFRFADDWHDETPHVGIPLGGQKFRSVFDQAAK